MEHQKWPDEILIVRHGQSAGNVARDEAVAAGHPVIQIASRDMDVPLSELGERQAAALGRWFAALPPERRPTVVLTSPYVRTRDTARIVLETAGMLHDDLPIIEDERLREKEFGVLDRLTVEGVKERFPDQMAFRLALGKFYHRPPGGESWCDVILRLRSVTNTIAREYRHERVLIVAHQVVVLCFRYILEGLTEEQILTIDIAQDVANCSVTSYEYEANVGKQGKLVLSQYNFTAPLEDAGEEVTRKSDVPVAPK
ncbi:MAG: histidine phosphatase family protein [Capsulimonas sp.]|uniref:histidine phosphatase family protein n=1 Tax=Capsulimonas sp. TaxID=2494211 RepID=UPI0032636A00